MEFPQLPSSPVQQVSGLRSTASSTVNGSGTTRLVDDVTSLTSFNPFSEEDEHDQSSYTLVTSLFSRVRNSLAAPLSSAVAAASGGPSSNITTTSNTSETKRPSERSQTSNFTSPPSRTQTDAPKPRPFKIERKLAPPLVSIIPTLKPTLTIDGEHSGGRYSPTVEQDGGMFVIPGFPIQDDARSVHTNASFKRSGSVSKVIRRIRGEGLSRDYWMDDANCKECYYCKSIFTTWRRKHHCRICGQIFCSRCASSIINGSRFGHDGSLRVCNLCLEKLERDDDDDDDHRSVISNISNPFSFNPEASGLGYYSQSPFTNSQLFGRADEPSNLYSIAEAKRQLTGSDGSGFRSRPLSPAVNDPNIGWEGTEGTEAAPFRRGMADDDGEKEPVIVTETYTADHTPSMPRSATKTPDFPSTIPFPTAGTKSSIAFPGGSPEYVHGLDSPHPSSHFRSRVNSTAETEIPTPFHRSRVQSRLNELALGEIGWRTRRESTAYAQELNLISMFHLRIMLRQMLRTEGISNIKEWEETLLKLALRIARDLTFTAYPNRAGADMDVRRYVKIKKIPGGAPGDSEYVGGAVITKNVAHKQMSRSQRNPRIMFVAFPLEFQRVEGQYMHFGQIVRQEKEYLGNLASRIAALRPHIVLVEASVSRLALEALVKHNIAVARSVKKSAMQFAARMTNGAVVTSIDKLATEPRLGHCAQFRIQTFDHPLIPGRRKTYMRFEGCHRDLGCTIILRGGDADHLKRVKRVTMLLAFIVRNLKLETHLWKDSVITLPQLTADASQSLPFDIVEQGFNDGQGFTSGNQTDDQLENSLTSMSSSAMEESQPEVLSKRIQESLEPYLKTFISVSATLRFLPPYPVLKMKELDVRLKLAKRAWEDEVVRQEQKVEPAQVSHSQDTTITCADDIVAQIDALRSPGLASSPIATGVRSPRLDESGTTDYFDHKPSMSASTTSLSSMFNSLTSTKTGRLDCLESVELKKESDIHALAEYELVKWQHEEHLRIWQWYLRKNHDDFVVDKYQCITMLEFTVPISELGHQRACFPPRMKYITFYGENDMTMGQFIEGSVYETLTQFLDPKAICSGKGCEEALARHCKVFVHNTSRLLVYVDKWSEHNKPWPRIPAEHITTWSACRICGSTTPYIPVSEEMLRYSFAKFLELHFYPADVQLVQGAGCQHNIYQHHARFFAYRQMTLTFRTDPITLYEVIFPPARIHIHSEILLALKNSDCDRLIKRNELWYSALVDDLKLINIDAATGDEEADSQLTAEINVLIERAETERADIARLIRQVYSESAPSDTLALNMVRAERQDRIVAWQLDFEKLPKPKAQMSEKESRVATAFGSVRAMWPSRYGILEQLQGSTNHASDVEERPLMMRRVTGDSIRTNASTSDMSDAERSKRAPSVIHKAPIAQLAGGVVDTDGELDHTMAGSGSDSTIPATRGAGEPTDVSALPSQDENSENDENNAPPRKSLRSRLPRRSGQHPSVAELVKRYQEYLPASLSTELAETAFPPPVPPFAESDQEGLPPVFERPTRPKAKLKQRALKQKESISDFEHSYAANVAPRYLTNRRTILSRIPGPASSVDSRESSRRTSPDKRPTHSKFNSENTIRGFRSVSPPPPSTIRNKPRVISRGNAPKERIQLPRAVSGTTRGTPRRPTLNSNATGSKVSNIARHFERLHRDNEKANRRYAVIRGRRARPVATAPAKVAVFDSVKEALRDECETSDSQSEADDEDEGDGDGDDSMAKKVRQAVGGSTAAEITEVNDADVSSSISATNTPQQPETTNEGDTVNDSQVLDNSPSVLPSPPTSPLSNTIPTQTPCETPSDMETSQVLANRPSGFMKALSGFWSQTTVSRQALDYDGDDPLADPEHIFRESCMVVRTDEPTSIIALALNSPQYRELLAKSRVDKRREPKLAEGGEAFMPDDVSVSESMSTWGVVNVDSTDDGNPTADLRVPSSKLPWAISFESGDLTISCTILYPEQFDALRRTYSCDKSMVESLARCVKWNASGGKSGSAFLKTRDDRFIAKELSRAELETMATFGPAYFEYMSSAVTNKRPTLLAKVFGCYKIVFRKATKDKDKHSRSKPTQMNLLVMENLFYNKRFSKIFDLKGSTRNRHVQSTGRENEVLLDENLVETAHLAPLYVREHAKRILRVSLFNDTKFLSDINVMDYSLVVGVDSVSNELVMGIVDYIRTYTWDKKLESWVKDSAFLAGAGKGEPTIITPKQYRLRFLSAMERYFLLVPDRWMKLKDRPDDEGNSLLDLWPDW